MKPAANDTAALHAREFREAMSKLASGVTIVTAHVEGRPWCLTVSACCSVSASPPALLVSLGAGTVSAQAIQRDGRFGVSVLGERTRGAADLGSAPGTSKFGEEICVEGAESASPVVAGALSHFDCGLERAVPVFDHVILVGLVDNVLVSTDDVPLLYYSRAYRTLEPMWRVDRLENMV